MSNLKILKIICVFAIIMFLGINLCYAIDLDTDLTDFTSSNTIDDSINTQNIATNTTNSTNTINTNFTSDNNSEEFNANTYSGTTSGSNQDNSSLPIITSTTSSSELTLSDILNIMLIVVGVLLILLSIAILIRLKH